MCEAEQVQSSSPKVEVLGLR